MKVKSLDQLNQGDILTEWTTLTRPTNAVNGYIGRNTSTGEVEAYYNGVWAQIGGGATGGGGDTVFIENEYVITTSYTIPAGKSALSVGDGSGNITIQDGVTVTFADSNSRWIIL